MSKSENKIDADDRTVYEVLNERKFTVDYFQREYNWEQIHIEQLITDLTSSFLGDYSEGDHRAKVEEYNTYYLGPFVLMNKDGVRSIIDGQQRLTSITLFLIYLNNLQKAYDLNETIEPLIFSEKYGKMSFNIQVSEREPCLNNLFQNGSYTLREDDDESTVNMIERYNDIDKYFPKERLRAQELPYFLDWLKYNVIFVEITAYSDDNAYTIFESMNDRGLNLTPTEMLKGYILSRFDDVTDRDNLNAFWKKTMQMLREDSKDEDQQFFQAWLRSQYADTIRKSKAGSSNEDFEKIGTRFHSWFRDNLNKVGLSANNPSSFKNFIDSEMKYYVQAYSDILRAQKEELEGWEQVFYIGVCGIAPSLSLPLMLAPLKSSDTTEEKRIKINEVARYIETFTIKRSINFRSYGASSLRYTMYMLVKEIRGASIEELKLILSTKLEDMEETWDGFSKFRMHGMNKWFVKYLLSRITGFLDMEVGESSSSFSKYYYNKGGKQYEVEHIWADKFDEHRDEFDQQNDFDEYRNKVGDLILLPQGSNQSYGAKQYTEKLEHYIKENILAKSLHPKTYENNPNFTNMAKLLGLNFRAHETFSKQDIDTRQKLLKNICVIIWGTESDQITNSTSNLRHTV